MSCKKFEFIRLSSNYKLYASRRPRESQTVALSDFAKSLRDFCVSGSTCLVVPKYCGRDTDIDNKSKLNLHGEATNQRVGSSKRAARSTWVDLNNFNRDWKKDGLRECNDSAECCAQRYILTVNCQLTSSCHNLSDTVGRTGEFAPSSSAPTKELRRQLLPIHQCHDSSLRPCCTEVVFISRNENAVRML